MLKLETTEIALFHCDIVINQYEHHSKVPCTFVPNNRALTDLRDDV